MSQDILDKANGKKYPYSQIYGEVEIKLHSFLILALDGVSDQRLYECATEGRIEIA
jgi:hypothetical protein